MIRFETAAFGISKRYRMLHVFCAVIYLFVFVLRFYLRFGERTELPSAGSELRLIAGTLTWVSHM